MSTAEALVAVHGIGKRFGDHQAVVDMTLAVHPGEVVGVVGANGGGKTTTLRMLAGLLTADCGRGVVLGFELPGSTRRIRERVGYMPQGSSFYPSLSVRENLRFRADAFSVPDPELAVDQLLQAQDLTRFAGTRAEALSGGWARLLQLAGALIHRPSLLLLDEPTAGLDVANRHQVWERITALARSGVGVVLSTHDLAEAERCTRLALLADGVTLAAGSTAEVIASADAAVLVLCGDGALAMTEVLAVQPGVLASYPQANALRVVVDKSAQQQVSALLKSYHYGCASCAPTLEDATLALLRRRRERAP